MWKLCVFVACLGSKGICSKDQDIRNLIGEPDYRKVSLHWEVANSNELSAQRDESSLRQQQYHPATFQVRYCELQTWGAQRCRTKTVPPVVPRTPRITEEERNQTNRTDFERRNWVDEDETDSTKDEMIAVYETDIAGLRMATTYSFEVRPSKEAGTREYRAHDVDTKNDHVIVIPTKGFSAKATQCLPHASEIEVSTGPHFAGRIAVEATDGERCAIDGQPDSARDTYTLRINHADCGSQVNATTVATFVLVQENLPILTHSTRRFLVLCTYQPETLTVRAGLNLPTNHQHRGQAKITMEDGEEYKNNNRQGRNERTGRHLQRPEALVKEEDDAAYVDTSSASDSIHPVALIVLLMVVCVSCLIAWALRWNLKSLKKMTRHFDNESVTSDISATSDLTPTDSLDSNYIAHNQGNNRLTIA